MALTDFQRTICQLIAQNRIANGESYIAGGVALNLVTKGLRTSRDIDLFHDTRAALDAAWKVDRDLLAEYGYELNILHERQSYIEVLVSKDEESVLMQWTRDSAFRFFPLVTNDLLGLILHPFDLATNKVLALAGRLEIRDWVDLIGSHDHIQHLGYLIWAASGKDPGFSPASILSETARSSHYSEIEFDELTFAGDPPDFKLLSARWRGMLNEAKDIIDLLPEKESGKCLLDGKGMLYAGSRDQILRDLHSHRVFFHSGSIRGAFPQFSID